MPYEPVIGLEVHAELLTESKMFCGCAVVDSTSAAPNTVVCEVCAGMPGTLPVINERAVEFGLRVALALNCEVPGVNVFARKNYFYPDLPKGYQISQYELPLAINGYLDIETSAGPKRVRIRRVHLEEDTGKLNHNDEGRTTKDEDSSSFVVRPSSLVDLNRAGVPLLEIVTEPDLRSVEEVRAYATALRQLLRYLGVNNGDMEKGVIRFEANISVRPAGSDELRPRTEVKNLNSFKAMERAAAYEIERQSAVWESGGSVAQETMGWNDAEGATVSQRGKEHAHDYRYFPEPDLPPLELDRAWIERIRADLPELPAAKRDRFMHAFGLTRYDSDLLTSERAVAEYFEAVCAAGAAPKAAANWITGELFRLMNAAGQSIEQVKVTPRALAGLVALTNAGTINSNTAKTVFEEMFATGQDADAIVASKGLAQVSDTAEIEALIDRVLAANPEQVKTFLGGKATVEQWFFGQVMKASQGRGNPQVIRGLLAKKLKDLSV